MADLTVFLGAPGGPRTREEADRWGRHEEAMREFDRLGARDGDDRLRDDVRADCQCRYCRFYRGEGGVRLVMCEQDWYALPYEAMRFIHESCAG